MFYLIQTVLVLIAFSYSAFAGDNNPGGFGAGRMEGGKHPTALEVISVDKKSAEIEAGFGRLDRLNEDIKNRLDNIQSIIKNHDKNRFCMVLEKIDIEIHKITVNKGGLSVEQNEALSFYKNMRLDISGEIKKNSISSCP